MGIETEIKDLRDAIKELTSVITASNLVSEATPAEEPSPPPPPPPPAKKRRAGLKKRPLQEELKLTAARPPEPKTHSALRDMVDVREEAGPRSEPVTLNAVRTKFKDLVLVAGRDKAVEILNAYNVDKVPDLDPDVYESVVGDIDVAIAEAKAALEAEEEAD